MNEWLAARSFERAHEVISAINTVSMHAKLSARGIADTTRTDEARKARAVLTDFLAKLGTLVAVAQRDPEAVGAGADPRLGNLARRFVAAQKHWPQQSALYAQPAQDLVQLLSSADLHDQERLIGCLRELRNLIEQNVHSDVVGILGDI
jgi:hypothetical protein